MKKETPHSSQCRAGLADGLNDSGARCGMPTTGRDQGKAQSERAKRGLRHTDPRVASSARPSGTGSRHQMGQTRRLGSGQQDRWRQGNGPAPLRRAGAVHPLPSLRLSPTSKCWINNYGLSLERCNFEKRKWITTEMNGLGKARIDEVKSVVTNYYGVTRADLESACRTHRLARIRQKAMRLAYELTGHSYPSLGRAFGNRDHSTILYGDRKICDLEAADPKLAAELNECRARIAQLVSERIGKMVTMQASSSAWSPPPPARTGWLISKPSTVIASIDGAAWLTCAA